MYTMNDEDHKKVMELLDTLSKDQAEVRRGLLLWQEQHPEAEYFPDGADNFLWLLNEVESVHSQLMELYDKYYSRHNFVEVK